MAKNERRSQQKREKQKKKRELAKRRDRAERFPTSVGGLVRLASSRPFGPAWVSRSVWETEGDAPELVTVTVTRVLPGGLLLPQIVLVDRTCLGVKNAVVTTPVDEYGAADRMASLASGGIIMERCEPAFAQSVVFHAVSYARSLGFEPHRDFEPQLLEPRPASLVDTPLAKPERPIYVSGPHDDVRRVIGQLDRTVGKANYRFVVAGAPRFDWLGDEDDDLDLDALDGDDDEELLEDGDGPPP